MGLISCPTSLTGFTAMLGVSDYGGGMVWKLSRPRSL